MTATETPIQYGDYVFIKLLPDPNGEGFIFCANGFLSSNVWAGTQDNLNVKSFRNCLFQIFPNLHSANYSVVNASSTQFNLLKTLNPQNKLGQKYISNQLNDEKTKESSRIERIDLLNQKEITETFGKPILYGNKFTLKHLESGMFLESSARLNQYSDTLELKLTESPNSELYFEVKSTKLSKKKGDVTDYTESIKIFTPRLNNYITLGSVSGEFYQKKLGNEISFLKDASFPLYPSRRPRATNDNNSKRVGGSGLTPTLIKLVNYKHVIDDFIKTGDYIRISNEYGYLTIYNNATPKIFFQKYESLEYQYNHVHTVFQVVSKPDSNTLPIEEPIETIHPENIESRDPETKSYLIRHMASGKYLAQQGNAIVLVDSSAVMNPADGINPFVEFIGKPYHEFQFAHRSTEFKIKFIQGNDVSTYFDVGSKIAVPTANLTKNTAYFFGFDIPDEYLIKKLRPTWFGVCAKDQTERQFKYIPVPKNEIYYILQAESFANKFEDFLDFCTDLRTPTERLMIQRYNESKKQAQEEETKIQKEQTEAERSKQEKRDEHDQRVDDEFEERKRKLIEKKREERKQQGSKGKIEDQEKKSQGGEGDDKDNKEDDEEKNEEGKVKKQDGEEKIEGEEGQESQEGEEGKEGEESQEDDQVEGEEEFDDEEDEEFELDEQELDTLKKEAIEAVLEKEKELGINPEDYILDEDEGAVKAGDNQEESKGDQSPTLASTILKQFIIGEDKKKKGRRLAQALGSGSEESNPEKIEKECLLNLSKQMMDISKTAHEFLKDDDSTAPKTGAQKQLEEGKENQTNEEEIHQEENIALDPIKQWVVRELRIIDYINIALFNFFRADTIANIIKGLQTKYTDDGDFYEFDPKSFRICCESLIELLFSVTRRDYLNHLYNSQFVRVYIQCLTVTNVGFYKITPMINLLEPRRLILECCKEFLWDQDLDALGQLNYYQANLINAIRSEQDYEALYIRLLDNQCRSKAPNLDNKIAVGFINEFLTIQDDLTHTFPRIVEEQGSISFQFVRRGKPELNQQVTIQQLADSQSGTGPEEIKPLAQYLLQAFRLVNSLSNLNNLVFSQTMIKHYPYDLLERASKETSTSFFELSSLIMEAITNVYMNYFKLPIEKFPAQIQIVGTSEEIRNYMNQNNQQINESFSTLLSDIEIQVLTEKNIKNEIIKCQELFKVKKAARQLTVQERHREITNNNLDNVYVTLNHLRSFLATSIDEISIEYLRETNELFCKLLSRTVEDNIPERQELKTKDSVSNGQANQELVPSQVGEGGNGDVQGQKYTSDIALEILRMFETIQKKFTNYAATKIIEIIKDKALKKSAAVAAGEDLVSEPSETILLGNFLNSDDISSLLTFENSQILAKMIENCKDDWKNRAALYKVLPKDKNSLALQANYKVYSTDNLTKLLFEMVLFKKTSITKEAIRELKNISKFENSLYIELRKMTMISDNRDMKRVSDIINIVCKLNYYTRMYNCKTSFQREITQTRLKEMYKEIDSMMDDLLFTIYDPKKHFRYEDYSMDPKERFLKGFAKWKTPRWDKPFKINPEAVSKNYQKIFHTLQVPKALFEVISMTISITGDTYNDLEYLFVVRKAVIILCAFVFRNQENQIALHDQKFIILSYYQQPFINQTCDVMILFTELMRDNKRLQKLPIKYLYDITWYTFLGTLDRQVTYTESNSYLCTALISLHFLSKMTIGGFDAESSIATKFSQITTTLQTDTSLNIFNLYGEGQVIDLPFHYYSIREFFSSWLEISKDFIKTAERLDKIFGQYQLNHWNLVLENPSIMFHFELRNFLSKTLAVSWYGTSHRFKVVDKFENFKNFMFRLFADLSAYISVVSAGTETWFKGLNSYDFQIDPDTLFGEDPYIIKMRDFLKEFKDKKLGTAKVQVYMEEISLMNLWKEYIYEGCIGLLNTIARQEAENMMMIIDYNDEKFPNLMSYYLFLLQKIASIQVDLKENPFIKIDNDLQKISILPEYKSIKDKIHQVAQVIRESRPNLKRIKSTSVKTRGDETGTEMYDQELDRLLRDSKITKETNTFALATILASIPYYKKIVSEIIIYVKKEYKKIKSSELTFIMKLLRKLIERENTKATEHPIYMWEMVKITDLQKMQKIQNLYKELGLTEFLVNILNEFKSDKILKEFLQVGVAYLYGGNSDVQEEFYKVFIADYDNRVLNTLREKLAICGDGFKTFEKMRLDNLYQDSLRNTFEYMEVEEKTEGNKFFGRIRENFPPELTIPCMKVEGHSTMVLLLSFIQGLAEKQCTSLQNFMREQSYIDEMGEPKKLANSFDFLSEFRSLFNSFFKIHSIFNIQVGIKLIDVLTEYIQGDVALNVNSLLNKTLLFDMTRILTDFNNSYHLLPRGYDANPNTGELRELKSKVIIFVKTLVELPDSTILSRIQKYLDVEGLMETLEANLFEFFGFNAAGIPENGAYVTVWDKVNTLEMDDFKDGVLMDALNIYMIFCYLWEDRHAFRENMSELINCPKRSIQKRETLEILIFTFCPKTIRGVEFNFQGKQKDLIKYWFPKLPVCRYLLDSTMQTFEMKVDRSNTQTKIADLIRCSDEVIPQMYSDYAASQRLLGLNTTNFYFWLRIFGDILAIAINVTNIATLKYNSATDAYSYSPIYGQTIEFVCVVINVFVAFALFIAWFVTSSKRHLTAMWERYSDSMVKELGILPQSILQKLEERQYSELSTQECELILKIKGMNSEESEILVSTPELYAKIYWNLQTTNIRFLFASLEFIWHFIYLFLSVGSIFTPICASLLIADIAIQSDAIMQVFRAIGTNWRQFLWTLFLLMNIALFYTFISFYALQDAFVDDGGNQICEYAFGCFLSILNLGLRSGGGIADVIQGENYTQDDAGTLIVRVIFDLTFFIIMITILLNLIFGMIIDAFSNLRDKKNSNEEDGKNICFICGIDRSEFERYISFDEHTTQEHNLWDYIFCIVYIKEKFNNKRTEMNELENYVNDKYRSKNFQFFPVGRSSTLEKIKKAIGTQEDAETAQINETVSTMAGDVKNLQKSIQMLLNASKA